MFVRLFSLFNWNLNLLWHRSKTGLQWFIFFHQKFCLVLFLTSFVKKFYVRLGSFYHSLFWTSLLALHIITIFTIFCNLKKANFMAHFYGWDSIAWRLEPVRGGSLLFTTKFPETLIDTHLIDLGRMNVSVDLGAPQWFWKTRPTDWKFTALTTRALLLKDYCS